MELLKSVLVVSEKAANIARAIRHNGHLFELLVQQKSDAEANPRFVTDFKTLADVLIQQMVKHDLGRNFPELKEYIYGEENNIFSNKLGDSITVDVLATAQDTAELLEKVLDGDSEAAELLASEVHKNLELSCINTHWPEAYFELDLNDCSIWIDPIDSTAEYINGKEEQTSGHQIFLSGLRCVTVLIGVYSRNTGDPILGVINQPFFENTASGWRGRCVWGVRTPSANIPWRRQDSQRNNVIVLSSSENEEIKTNLRGKHFSLVEAAGAGYKILTVVEGLADAYVLSKDSTFRWDTCGPQAILRSLGGEILNYNEAIKNNLISVNYKGDKVKCAGDKNDCNFGGILAYKNPDVLRDIIDCLAAKKIT